MNSINDEELRGCLVNNLIIDNVTEKCRICLNPSDLISLQAVVYEDLTCNGILMSTLSLQLTPVEGYPQNVCSNCVDEIIKIYTFKLKIENTDKHLSNILNKKEGKLNETCLGKDHDYFVYDKPLIKSPTVKSRPKSIQNPDLFVKRSKKSKKVRMTKEDDMIEEAGKILSTKALPSDCKNCKVQLTKKFKANDKSEAQVTSKLLPCTQCEKKFTKSKLLEHIRVHTREQPFVCKICNMSFSIKSNLKRHMMIHTGERPFFCDVCGKGFIQGLSLKVHRQTHFKSKDACRRGPRPRDPNLPTLECQICGQTFKREYMYRAHLLQKHSVTSGAMSDPLTIIPLDATSNLEIPRPFKCPICHQCYTSKQYLKQHQRIHGEKKYLCNVCGKRFHQNAALQTHSRIHTGEKPHQCNICKKSFAYISSLDTHMLLHTGEKPHVCNVCGKAFTQVPHLKHHMRIHTGEKPYQCTYCSKCFALKGNLTVHIRTHTGETPYYCDLCGKGFHDSSSMKKHRKGHGDFNIQVLDVMEKVQQNEDF
ncbi:zinc finger protein 883-like [Onthophagus taurus]|uniref:zinc finger protein 883-like n=1 Tax=Onthophagus taurus TaxID=166361 RepID=UPI000C205C10|nr:zinc finger protein OZF-like [Onthophagus taurus]